MKTRKCHVCSKPLAGVCAQCGKSNQKESSDGIGFTLTLQGFVLGMILGSILGFLFGVLLP